MSNEAKTKRFKRDENDEDGSKRATLFLKPVLAKRPWFLGGKALFSRDGQTLYCASQGGVGVVKNFSVISQVVAKDDDVVSFALAVRLI